MDDQTWIIIVALILLAVIEICALLLGFNGTLLATVIGIFGAAVGYTVKVKRG